MIDSFEATRLIHQHAGSASVIPTMTALRLWRALGFRHDRDYPLVGAMGKASSVGLGLALAQPQHKVIVLDGDGSLLNNLGTLVTIGHMAPPNLYHFVYQDGAYTTTGGQPIPGATIIRFAEMAKAAGYRAAYDFHDLEAFATELPRILSQPGPVLVCLRVRHPQNLPPMDLAQIDRRKAIRQIRQTLTGKPA
ncbi:MAG: thiamine pyrophosphate-dependent enzyme [Dehalococcoidia bacterium]|nr:thiamine pyrophosphate-dependent enzyme [Dehalococcoidia bacterium]MDW8120295.1 thiamine pyrophosphate-dependent enzyme [Chloroflexota bacterium]